jgi:superfamily II DNA helicase RecQ
MCDNCYNSAPIINQDLTKEAQQLLEIIRQLAGNGTMALVADIYRGTNKKSIQKKGFDNVAHFGEGSHLDRDTIERVLHYMATEGILKEVATVSPQYGVTVSYLWPGPNAARLKTEMKVILGIRQNTFEKQ